MVELYRRCLLVAVCEHLQAIRQTCTVPSAEPKRRQFLHGHRWFRAGRCVSSPPPRRGSTAEMLGNVRRTTAHRRWSRRKALWQRTAAAAAAGGTTTDIRPRPRYWRCRLTSATPAIKLQSTKPLVLRVLLPRTRRIGTVLPQRCRLRLQPCKRLTKPKCLQ